MSIQKESTDNSKEITRGYEIFKSLGFKLVASRGRSPIEFGWAHKDFKTSPIETVLQSGNYAIILTDEDLVIDVDPRNFENGDDPLVRLVNSIGELTTLAVLTGANGLHIYLKKNKDIPIYNTLSKYPGLEFKTKGSVVTGPGSIHHKTKILYKFYDSDIMYINKANSKLIEQIQRPEHQKEVASTVGEINTKFAKSEFELWLKTEAKISVQGDSGDKTAYNVACRGKALGVSKKVCLQSMLKLWNPKCLPPWEVSDLSEKVNNAYRYADFELGVDSPETIYGEYTKANKELNENEAKWLSNKNGTLKKCTANLINLLKTTNVFNGLFSYNTFDNTIRLNTKKEWQHLDVTTVTEEFVTEAKFLISSRFYLEFTSVQIYEAISYVAKDDSFNPVVDYLKDLTWDGVERVKSWLIDYLHVEDSAYHQQCGLITLVGAVKRACSPGSKHDTLLILEGEQGIGKSTVCSILGLEWAGEISINPKERDTIDAMQGLWIIEYSELDGFNVASAQSMKSFLSTTHDKVRLAYARRAVSYPRQCIFIGTTNSLGEGYLRDSTGARRYLPVVCPKQIDTVKFKEDVHQLWAEAYKMHLDGVKNYLDTEDLIEAQKKSTNLRQEIDIWLDTIEKYVEARYKSDLRNYNAVSVVTVLDVLLDCLGISIGSATATHKRRVQNILVAHCNFTSGIYWCPLRKRATRGYRKLNEDDLRRIKDEKERKDKANKKIQEAVDHQLKLDKILQLEQVHELPIEDVKIEY